MVFSDFLNLFFFDRKEGIGGVIKALQSRGGFQSLAEPNLIAYNGQEASFLAGGEFPVPIVQGNSGSVTIVFKEFGIRLNFTPTIAGDVIRLKVRPEVSALDFANGITLEGFRVPALTTRRAETDVELRDGQSFAIAGLIDNIRQDDTAATRGGNQTSLRAELGLDRRGLCASRSRRNDAGGWARAVLWAATVLHVLDPRISRWCGDAAAG